jgi:hypothetical protein
MGGGSTLASQPDQRSLLGDSSTCLRVAASSMRSLAMPLSMALVMPPTASTSSMMPSAASASSCRESGGNGGSVS